MRPKNRLYRNLGGFRFKDVTDEAGVGGGAGYGLGVCVGDYDNDGYQDLFVNNYGENILYHNNGDGTFTTSRGRRAWAAAARWAPGPASWTMTTTAGSTSTWPTT